MNNKIIILLATFNGAKFLKDQIDSIIHQSYTNWQLIIRDDGSIDNTVKIIKDYIKIDKRILLYEEKFERNGACINFSILFSFARKNKEFDYLMFSDQDDIWLPNKIEESLKFMKLHEIKSHNQVLIYTDLTLIDEKSTLLPTKIGLLKKPSFNRFFFQNYAFGCTMIMNKNFVELVKYIPKDAENHDAWISLVAVYFEKCFYLNKSLIHYRQHSFNVTQQGGSLKLQLLKYTRNIHTEISKIKKRLKTLSLLEKEYNSQTSHDIYSILRGFFVNLNKGKFLTIYFILTRKLFKYNLIQTLALLYCVFFYFKKIKLEKL